MSAYQTIGFPQSADGLTSFRGGVGARNPTDPALGAQISTARVATLAAFAGAVLIQAAILALAARLALSLDSVMLPNPAVSAIGLALGVVLTVASKSISRRRRLAA